MGSLASRPKAPAVQKPVVITAPAYMPAPATAPAYAPPAPAGNEEPAPEETAAARSAASLLDRRRGAFSTVLTGFRGLLGDSMSATRKTLLGE